MSSVRVAERVAVQSPDGSGAMVLLRADAAYDADDRLVKAYPWAFVTAGGDPVEKKKSRAGSRRGRGGRGVEQATAAPGEKRDVKRVEPAGGWSADADPGDVEE